MAVPSLSPRKCLSPAHKQMTRAQLNNLVDFDSVDWETGRFATSYLQHPACKLLVSFATEAEGRAVTDELNGALYPRRVCRGLQQQRIWVASASPVEYDQVVLFQGHPSVKRLFQHCASHGPVRHIEQVVLDPHDPLVKAYSGAQFLTQVTMASPEATRALLSTKTVEGLDDPVALEDFNLPMHVMITGTDLDLPGLPLLDRIATEIAEQCVWRDPRTGLQYRGVAFVSHSARDRFMEYIQTLDPKTLPDISLYDPKELPDEAQRLWALPTDNTLFIHNLPTTLSRSEFANRVLTDKQEQLVADTAGDVQGSIQRRYAAAIRQQQAHRRKRARGRGPRGRARKGKMGRKGKCGQKARRGRGGRPGRSRRSKRVMRPVGRGPPAFDCVPFNINPRLNLVTGDRSMIPSSRVYIQCQDAEDYRLLINVVYGMKFSGRRALIAPMSFMGAARGRMNKMFVDEETVHDPAMRRKMFIEASDDDLKSPRIEAGTSLGAANCVCTSTDAQTDHGQQESPLKIVKMPSCMSF